MKYFNFKIPLIFTVAISLSACQSLNTGANVDPELNSGRQAQIFSKSGVQSCVVGGLLGGIAGALIGASKGSDEAAVGAVAGAAVGCSGALATNYYLEKQRKQYANKEQRLNAHIAEVRKTNSAAEESIVAARNVLKRDQQTLSKLREQIRNKNVQASEAKKELARVDANLKTLNERLTVMKEHRDMYKEVAQAERKEGANVAKLDAEIKKLTGQIATLENLVLAASKERTSIRLG